MKIGKSKEAGEYCIHESKGADEGRTMLSRRKDGRAAERSSFFDLVVVVSLCRHINILQR
jgi:uncharacterized protein YdiU (UPF0061 family)